MQSIFANATMVFQIGTARPLYEGNVLLLRYLHVAPTIHFTSMVPT